MNNPNCGRCGMLNHAGFCQLTACIYPCSTGMGGYINKPVTNADRIRSMTDEELAIWYCKFRDCLKCPHGKGCRVVGEGVLNWLKQGCE